MKSRLLPRSSLVWLLACPALTLVACDGDEFPDVQVEPDARMRFIGGDMQVPDASLPDRAVSEPEPAPAPEGEPAPQPAPEPEPQGCAQGEQRPCPDGCGVQRCADDGTWGICEDGGAAERCNGADDDCDGNIDESFQGLGIGCSVMIDGCNAQGVFVCNAGGDGTECQPFEEVGPEAEICDGVDNDCDNEVDEDFPGRFCCTEDFHCPNNGTCEGGECVGGPDPEPDVLPGFDPAMSCDAAIELDQFGRFDADTGFALPAIDGSCGGDGPEQVFWFEFAEATDVVLVTDGSSYDTVLHVRTDCLQAGSEIACNDDGGAGTASRVELRAQANQRYYVILDAFSLFGGGPAQLGFWPAGEVPECLVDADCGARMACVDATCEVVPAVNCQEAIAIDGPGQFMANSDGAADELGAGCGQPTGGEVIYHLRLDRPADVVASTEGSGFDTILSVRTACEDQASELICNDDGAPAATSLVAFEAMADTDYFLIVDGYNGASGAVALDVQAEFGCLEDAECEAGFSCDAGRCVPPGICEAPIVAEPGRYEGSTDGLENGFDASCGNASGGELAYQLRFDAPTPVALSTNGSAFDTILSVRTVCDDQGSEIACDDDGGEGTRSLVEFNAAADTDYFVFVDGYNGQSGAYVLDVVIPGPPPEPECDAANPCAAGACVNGACVEALACEAEAVGPGATMGTTEGAANDYAPGCGLAGDAPDVIYAFATVADADVTVDTLGSDYDTVLAVVAADCETELFCNDDAGLGRTSSVSFRATAGTLYYFVVDGYDDAAGAYTLNVTVE